MKMNSSCGRAADVDHRQLAGLDRRAAMKLGSSAMPRPAIAASRIMSPLLTRKRDPRADGHGCPSAPAKRQSATPRLV